MGRMVQLTGFTHEYDGERLSGVRTHAADGTDGTGGTGGPFAVLLHGAGNGSERRLRPLLAEFTAHGCPALAFDFSGHGESTGALAELSLRRRFEQATAVIDAQVPPDRPLVLVGFSMSGQTVADLVRHYGDRASAIGLCSPAVYTPESWDVPFGDGTGRFTELIRTPDAWRASPALAALLHGPCGTRRAGHGRGDSAAGHGGRPGRPAHRVPVHPLRTPGRGAPAGPVVPRAPGRPAGVRHDAAEAPRLNQTAVAPRCRPLPPSPADRSGREVPGPAHAEPGEQVIVSGLGQDAVRESTGRSA
jgi:pimeloyl-ACP methyl ester carboxylesterase